MRAHLISQLYARIVLREIQVAAWRRFELVERVLPDSADTLHGRNSP